MNEPANVNDHSAFRSVFLIAIFAWAIRVIVAAMAYGGRDIVRILWPRGIEPLGIAKSLLEGSGFSSPFAVATGPTAFLPPVYPVILAAIEKVFGIASKSSAWAILTIQCTFSALTCVAVYYLALHLFNHRIAQRAAWGWALFPYAVLLPTNIIWESALSALMMVTGVLIVARTLTSDSGMRWAAIGAYFSFACLVNAAFLLLLPALLLYSVLNRENGRRTIWCAAVFLTCLLPWTLRNYVVFNKLVPLRDNFALELWIGNREGATTEFTPEIHPAFSASELEEYQRLGEIGYMSRKLDLSAKFIREERLVFLRNTAGRIVAYWTLNLHAFWLMVPVVSFIGLAGIWLLMRRSHPLAWLLGIPLLIYPLPYYLTHPDLRYLHPLQPLLVILAAYATTISFGKQRGSTECVVMASGDGNGSADSLGSRKFFHLKPNDKWRTNTPNEYSKVCSLP
jgi:4-amino-4-deoxy-L-arabinose transferase-like glycosyltransferase